ncbi:MAG TPA: hypothetical protein VFU86_06745 [Terriglobales bacterium]|nr:hypothetical protein [Terriglobales bacterium]
MSTSAVSIRTVFEETVKQVELDPTRSQRASERYSAVKRQIEAALPAKAVFQVGSFQRKTKIRPLDQNDPLDIDAAVCFGDCRQYAAPGTGVFPSTALETVRSALVDNKTYRLMRPHSDAPTVVLEYADGFKIELIPCFRDLTGTYPRPGGPGCYIVGTASGIWVPADYDYDANVITGLNQTPAVRKALVPSIKLIKAFLREKGSALKSFHIEILCARILPGTIAAWETKGLAWDYRHVLAYFLSQASSHLMAAVSLPGSYSPPESSGLGYLQLISEGYSLTQFGEQAWKIAQLGDTAEADHQWRQLWSPPPLRFRSA